MQGGTLKTVKKQETNLLQYYYAATNLTLLWALLYFHDSEEYTKQNKAQVRVDVNI